MAGKIKRIFYKLILASVFLLILTMTAAGLMAKNSIALEQQVRCGLQEHTHTPAPVGVHTRAHHQLSVRGT